MGGGAQEKERDGGVVGRAEGGECEGGREWAVGL